MSLADYWRGGSTGANVGLSSHWRSRGNIPDLSQYGAVRTEDIGSAYGPLPGDPGMEDPGFMGMFGEGVKEGFLAPFAGLGERLGLVEEGTRQQWRQEFEDARLGYLSGSPDAFRTIVAGGSEILPSLLPMMPAGKLASSLGALSKSKWAGRLVGASEGALAGWGETAGQGAGASALGVVAGGVLGGALPAAAMNPKSSKLSRSMGASEDLRDSVVKWEKEWLDSAGNLPREVYERAEVARGAIFAHQRKIENIVRGIDGTMGKLAKHGTEGMEKLNKSVDEALTSGSNAGLPEELIPWVERGRREVDDFTDTMVNTKLADDSYLLSDKARKKYLANKGSYLHRSREAWDNPKFRNQYLNEDGTWNESWQAYVDEFARVAEVDSETATGVMVDAINRASTDPDFNIPGGGGTLKGADLRTRMKKGQYKGKDVLSKALGEYTDPRINLRKSIFYMANDLEWNKAFDDIAEYYVQHGDAKWMKRTDGVYQHQLPSSNYGTLKGRGATRANRRREATLYFKDEETVNNLIASREAAKTSIFHTVSGLTKAMKTVGSVQTHARNIASGNWMMGLQGHMPNMFDPTGWSTVLGRANPNKLFKNGIEGMAGGKHVEYEEAYQYLLGQNVVQQSTMVGDLKAYMKQGQKFLEGQSFRKSKDFAKWAADGTAKLYQHQDDFWKLQLFMKEKKRYMKHGLGAASAEKFAGQVVRDTMQIYSRVPKLVRTIRDFPLTGPFLSFPAEIARNLKNTTQLIGAELGIFPDIAKKYGYDVLSATEKAALAKVGRRRAAGMVAAFMGPAVLAKTSQAITGMDDDQVTALKESAVAPWSQNSHLFIMPGGGDGKESFIDLGFMDPYAYVKKPAVPLTKVLGTIMSAARSTIAGEGPGAVDSEGLQNLMRVFEEASSPATQPEIWAGELYRGVSDLARNSKTPLDHKAKLAAYRIYRAAAPGTVISLERFVRGLDMEGVREVLPVTSKYGQRYNAGMEALSMLGLRVTQSDIPKSIRYKGREYFSARSQGKRLYNDESRNKADRSLYRIANAKEDARRTNETAGRELMKHIQNARTLGLTNQQIIRQLNAGGVSKTMAISLVYYDKVPDVRF